MDLSIAQNISFIIILTDWITEFENELKNGDNAKLLQKISK